MSQASKKIGQCECRDGEVFLRVRPDGSAYVLACAAHPFDMTITECRDVAGGWMTFHAVAVGFGEKPARVGGCACTVCAPVAKAA